MLLHFPFTMYPEMGERRYWTPDTEYWWWYFCIKFAMELVCFHLSTLSTCYNKIEYIFMVNSCL